MRKHNIQINTGNGLHTLVYQCLVADVDIYHNDDNHQRIK